MKNIIKEFNKISIDFLTQTSNLVGNKYLYKYKLITKINCAYAIDSFIQKVLPFKEQIVNKNEDFFINKSSDANMKEYINDIIGIQEVYFKLDDNSKENIWDILLALVYLAEERYKLKNQKKIVVE